MIDKVMYLAIGLGIGYIVGRVKTIASKWRRVFK